MYEEPAVKAANAISIEMPSTSQQAPISRNTPEPLPIMESIHVAYCMCYCERSGSQSDLLFLFFSFSVLRFSFLFSFSLYFAFDVGAFCLFPFILDVLWRIGVIRNYQQFRTGQFNNKKHFQNTGQTMGKRMCYQLNDLTF